MRKIAAAFLLLAAGTTLLWIHFADRAGDSDKAPDSPPSAFTSERVKWEWQMLHDPATGQIPYGIREREIAFASTLPRRDRGNYFARRSGVPDPVWRNRGPWLIGGRTRALAFDVTGQDTILAGGVSSGVWRSSDRGESWTLTTPPEQSLGVTSIVQDSRPGKNHIWYYGTGEGRGNTAGIYPGTFYAGNGIYKSTNNGRSWFHLPTSGSGTPEMRDVTDIVSRLAIDRSNVDADELYAAVDGAIRRSTDGGASWHLVLGDSLADRYPSYADVAVTPSGVVYAMIASSQQTGGMYRSLDGISYTLITPLQFPQAHLRSVIEVSPSNENRLYLFSETLGGGKSTRWGTFSLWAYEYLSGDGSRDGGVWEDRSENIPDYGSGVGGYNSQFGYCMVLRVKPDDDDVVFLGGTNLYRSTDGFRTTENTAWVGGYREFQFPQTTNPLLSYYSYPGHHPDLHDVCFSPSNPDLMLTASDGGVHMTVDPLADSIEWTSLNGGYLTSQFYSVAINQNPGTPAVLVGGTQDNGTWRIGEGDDRDPWIEMSDSDGGFATVSSNGRRIYIAKQSGVLYAVDIDDMGEQTGYRRIDPLGSRYYLFIAPYAVDPNDSATVYYPHLTSLSRNRDVTSIPEGNIEGATDGWELFRYNIDQDGKRSSSIISTISCTDRNPSHRLWIGTSDSRVIRLDDGIGSDTTTVEVSSRSFPDSAWIVCIAVDPDDGDHAVVLFSNYGVRSLFATTDAGETWSDVSGNLEEKEDGSGAGPSTRWMKILNRNGGRIYLLGTTTGLFSTTRLDGDNTVWVREGAESIGYNVVTQVDARPADGLVAVATHGMGIFSATFEVAGVEEKATLEGRSGIVSILPNPIRQSGTITYDLGPGAGGNVTLHIYDLAGRVVSSRDLGTRHRGTQTASFPADHLPSGAYLLRLNLNDRPRAFTRILVE